MRRFPTYLLLLFLAACNLSQLDESQNLIETPVPTRTLSFQDVESTQESSIPTLAALPILAELEETEAACTPPEDWYEYTVVRGDSLTRIAQISNSTVDELIAANCLDNPNRIRVGSTIRVPNEPE